MSFQLMAWAVEQQTGSPTRKAVLLALANAANHHTGRCHPSVRRICQETEFGPTAVKNALADLETDGLVSRSRRRRDDGSLGTYEYSFPHVTPAEDLETGDGRPGTAGDSRPGTAGVSLNQEVLNQEGVDPNGSTHEEDIEQDIIERRQGLVTTVAPGMPRGRWKVDRRTVTDDEERLARDVLAYWNGQTGQQLTARTWLGKIVLRHREHPELGEAEHREIISTALANPWWQGDPSPSVVYGNDAIFERALMAATRGAGSPAERAASIAQAVLDEARGAS